MRQHSKRMASCSMMAAAGVIVMILGGALSLGMYASPMIVGLCLIEIGKEYGVRYQLMLWIVISILCFILVPNPEENLVFAGLFGWYPAVQPKFDALPKVLRIAVKLLLFNVVIIALECLLIFVLVPEVVSSQMLLLLLLLGNAMFVMYDRIIPKFDLIAQRFLKKK